MEEVELSWEDYLEETGSTAVPYGSFKHVRNNYLLTGYIFFLLITVITREYSVKLRCLKNFKCFFLFLPPAH